MVKTDAVPVVLPRRLSLAQADRDPSRSNQIDHTLTSFAHDLGGAPVAERLEQPAIEGEASLEIRHDQVEMVHTAHRSGA